MNEVISEMLLALKMQNISAQKIEIDLGFSNGVLGKASRGTVNLSKARFELFKLYYENNVIKDRSGLLSNTQKEVEADVPIVKITEQPKMESPKIAPLKDVAQQPKIVKHFLTENVEPDDFEQPQKYPIMTKAEYKKILDNCEFEQEYKALWERISADPNLSDREKREWKVMINAK